jgi:hypothetical protein
VQDFEKDQATKTGMTVSKDAFALPFEKTGTKDQAKKRALLCKNKCLLILKN